MFNFGIWGVEAITDHIWIIFMANRESFCIYEQGRRRQRWIGAADGEKVIGLLFWEQ